MFVYIIHTNEYTHRRTSRRYYIILLYIGIHGKKKKKTKKNGVILLSCRYALYYIGVDINYMCADAATNTLHY